MALSKRQKEGLRIIEVCAYENATGQRVRRRPGEGDNSWSEVLTLDERQDAWARGVMKAKAEAAKADSDGAEKFDGGKAPLIQGFICRFPLASEQVSRVSEYGNRKYGTYDGWEKLDDAFARYDDAFGRHIVLRASQGEYDADDSGLPHLAQRAWNAMATLELALRDGTIEMTNGNEIVDGKPVLGSNGRSNQK